MNDVFYIPKQQHLSCSLKDLTPGDMFVMNNKISDQRLFVVIDSTERGDRVTYLDVSCGNKLGEYGDRIVYPVDARIEWDYAKTLGRLV